MNKRMSSEKWSLVEQLFDKVVEVPIDQQQTLLNQLTDNDEIRVEVLSLLKHENEILATTPSDSVSFLGTSPAAINKNLLFAAGRNVSDYELLYPVALSNQSEVWSAQHGNSKDRVAIKFLRDSANSPTFERHAARFRNEVQILDKLDHPYIAPLTDSGQSTDGILFLVTPWIDGSTITRYCDHNQLDIRSRVQLLIKVMDAISFAHRFLVVHRDIKPENILVTASGDPIILDFGISKILHEPNSALDQVDSTKVNLTQATERPMTPAFATPEQVKGETISTATDVYALGTLSYLLLSGHHPYSEIAQPQHSSLFDRVSTGVPLTLSAVASKDAVSLVSNRETPENINSQLIAGCRKTTPKKLSRTLSGKLDAIVGLAMKKQPSERYQSVQELKNDFVCYLENRPIAAKVSGFSLSETTQRYPLRTILTSIGITAIVSAALLGWFYRGWQASENQSISVLAMSAEKDQQIELLLNAGAADKQIATAETFLAQGRVGEALKIVQEFSGEKTARLSEQDLIAFGEVCLATGNVTRGLKATSKFRSLEPNALPLEPQTKQLRLRWLMSRLLLEAGWAREADDWIVIPSPSNIKTEDHAWIAKLTLNQLLAATKLKQFPTADKLLKQIREPEYLMCLSANELADIYLTELTLKTPGENSRVGDDESSQMPRQISELSAPHSRLWQAKCLLRMSMNPGREAKDKQLLLQQALRNVSESRLSHHPLASEICFALAKLEFESEVDLPPQQRTQTREWATKAWATISDNSEWSINLVPELILFQVTDSQSLSDSQEILNRFDQFSDFRSFNSRYPYLETVLLELQMKHALLTKDLALAKISASHYRTLVNRRKDPDPLDLIFAMSVEHFCNPQGDPERVGIIEEAVSRELDNFRGVPSIYLTMSRDENGLRYQPQYAWLELYRNYSSNNDTENQLNVVMYLAETILDEHREAALEISRLAAPFVKGETEDEKPSFVELRWLKLMARGGLHAQIATRLAQLLDQQGDADIRDQLAAIHVRGLFANGEQAKALAAAKQFVDDLDPKNEKVKGTVWQIGEDLKSANNPAHKQWGEL